MHPLHIQQVYARMTSPGYEGPRGQVSAKTAGNLHRVLRQAFSQALSWRLIEWNPAAAASPPRARPGELAVVDQSLALRLLEGTAGTRLHLLFGRLPASWGPSSPPHPVRVSSVVVRIADRLVAYLHGG